MTTSAPAPGPLPRIVAHRGASGSAPENTLAAFRRAHALGAAAVEFDCKLSGDGRIVVHHDETLRRTARLEGRIRDWQAADLLHLDVGAWFAPEFAGETIPLLRNVMVLLDELGLQANVEFKPCAGLAEETGRAVAREIADYWPEHLPLPVVSSFSQAALAAAAEFLPAKTAKAMIWRHVPKNWTETVEQLSLDAIHCLAYSLDEPTARAIVERSIPLRCFTVNDPAVAERLFDWGVSSIFTDFPERFLPPR